MEEEIDETMSSLDEKDDGSNYTDWVRNLSIILIVAKKDYVLEAPLGEAPIPENQDVMNTWQSRADDYSLIQCGMLYSLERGSKSVLSNTEHMRCSKS